MKFRTGFVSNSSSSSFIAKGFVLSWTNITEENFRTAIKNLYPENYAKLRDEWGENDGYWEYVYDFLFNKGILVTEDTDSGAPARGKCFVGKFVQRLTENEELRNMEVTTESDEILNKIKETLTELDIETPNISIIVGSTEC